MMIRNISVRWITCVALAVFSAGSFADNSGDLHWGRKASPFTLQVIDSMTLDWEYQLTESLARWSVPNATNVDVINFSITSANDKRNIRKRCSAVDGKLRVCNAAYGNTGWLGMASYYYYTSTGHIVKATAKMNDSYSMSFEDMNHVTCQEIGHTIGLDHTSENGFSQNTCMDYSNSHTSQWPNEHDLTELLNLYAHLDTQDTYAKIDTGDGGGTCNAPPGKGCNKNNAGAPPMGIRIHKGKGYEIWVAPDNKGGAWVHHVTLVP